jgi:DNA-directed RNA polymerase subunit RPC12/RpoP
MKGTDRMSDSVIFWLSNRNCAGTKAAVIADQILVLYRDRYYVVMDGAAQTRGGKPLRFSSSSLPSVWKRALKGDIQSPVPSPSGMDSMTKAHLPNRERKHKEKPAMPELQKELTPEKNEKTPLQIPKSPRKTEAKPAIQPPVVVNCPYCNSRHEIPVDKGKNGKPFFMPCSKCKKEFAVRFLPITMYQAQVAGFR